MATSQWKLKEHGRIPRNNILALVVLDGWGENKPDQYNCIHVAETPTMDKLKEVSISFILFFIFCPLVLSTYGICSQNLPKHRLYRRLIWMDQAQIPTLACCIVMFQFYGV